MQNILLCLSIKHDRLDQFKSFSEQIIKQKDEYRQMLKRCDILSTRIWQKKINDVNYVFIYHDVGPDFAEKTKSFGESTHPFDKWMQAQIMDIYNFEDVNTQEYPIQIFDIKA